MSHPICDQPPPKPSDGDVWQLVLRDMDERRNIGVVRYGTPLQPHNGRDALVDLYQELLDAVAYVRQEIQERADLRAEVGRLQGVIKGLSARVAEQSELLSRRAEKKA